MTTEQKARQALNLSSAEGEPTETFPTAGRDYEDIDDPRKTGLADLMVPPAPSNPVISDEVVERLVAQAYLRGVEWRDENPGHADFPYRHKAAWDYADKVTSALSVKPQEGF